LREDGFVKRRNFKALAEEQISKGTKDRKRVVVELAAKLERQAARKKPPPKRNGFLT